MFLMPTNSNNELNSHNALYVGSTGSGKTSAVKRMKITANDQAVFFDVWGDYKGTFQGQQVFSYESWSDFAENLMKAREQGKPFKIAKSFSYKATQEDLEMFCNIVWGCGDASKPTLHAVLEEYASLSSGSGKMNGIIGDIVRIGRKFGLATHIVFQRGQEVEKTIFGNTPFKWIGYQEREKDSRYLADELGISFEAINELNKLDYVIRDSGKHDKGIFEVGSFHNSAFKA